MCIVAAAHLCISRNMHLIQYKFPLSCDIENKLKTMVKILYAAIQPKIMPTSSTF